MKSVSTVITFTALVGVSLARPQGTTTAPAAPKATPGLNAIDSFLDNIVIKPGPQPEGCAPYEIILARGTSEFGPFGFFVGDPLVANVKKALPEARGYAVDYPANSNKGSLETGAANVQARLNKKVKECPDMKYAFSGYSQGASVVRAGLQNVTDPAILDKIVAVVLFGDPGLNGVDLDAKKGQDPSLSPLPVSVYNKLRDFCNPGDPVCSRGTNFLAHIGYTSPKIATQAADFVINAFKGTPLPAKQDGSI